MSSFVNKSIERGILSYVLYEGKIDDIRDLNEVHFGYKQTQNIYKAMVSLDKAYKPITEEFIQNEFDAFEIHEEEFLEVLSTSPLLPTRQYKDLLIELAHKRQFSQILRGSLTELARISTIDIATKLGNHCTKVLEDIFSVDDEFEMMEINDIVEEPVQIVGVNYLPLPRRSVAILAGRGGIGKSGIALQSAIRHVISTGEKVFCWFSEDPLGETKQRAEKICMQLGVSMDRLEGKLFISNKRTFNIALKDRDTVAVNPELKKLQEATKDFGLLVLDPLRSFASNFDENSNSDMDNVTKEFAQWAKKENKIILLIHHAGKEGGIRGASSIVDASRLAYIVKEGKQPSTKMVEIAKDNFGISNVVGGDSIMITSIKG